MAQTRQAFSGIFTTDTPGASSGYRLAIDYVNPADAQAKPHSVQQVVQTLADGARIDTSAPKRCSASDQQLMAQGASACPADTRVGGGEIDVDTGGAPPREIQNRLTLFNAEDAFVLFTESTNTPGQTIRTASRTRVAGRTLTSDAPPLPGVPPPDAFTAIKRVRLAVEPVTSSAGDRALIATPGSCTPGGAWTNQARFTYRDGVSQTVSSASPCQVTGAGARSRRRAKPRVRVRGVPRRRCARGSFRARVRITGPSLLRSATVRLNGRRIRTTQKKRFSVRVKPRRPGTHRLTVVARDRAGGRGKTELRFRRCR